MRAGKGYWLVAVVATLWNALGCLDFTLTAARIPAYLANVSPDVIDWLDSAPTWTLIPWAFGVGGGLAGSLLLLARSRLAVPAFAVSFAGVVVSQTWQVSNGLPPSMTTPAMLALSAAIFFAAGFLLWFAWVRVDAPGEGRVALKCSVWLSREPSAG